MVKRALSWAAVVLTAALFVFLAGLTQVEAAAESPEAPPKASGLNLAGKAVDPFELAAGKVLVLIYVRTDCPVSNRYSPTIKALGQKYDGEVVFLLVYPDKTKRPRQLKST